MKAVPTHKQVTIDFSAGGRVVATLPRQTPECDRGPLADVVTLVVAAMKRYGVSDQHIMALAKGGLLEWLCELDWSVTTDRRSARRGLRDQWFLRAYALGEDLVLTNTLDHVEGDPLFNMTLSTVKF